MGFFAKLFRRKGGDLESKASRGSKKSRGRKNAKNVRDSPTELANEDVPPPPHASLQVQRNFVDAPAPRKVHGPDFSDGAHRVVLSPRNTAVTANAKEMYKGGPVDLDQSDIEFDTATETDENGRGHHPRLSTQRLQQFTEEQGGKTKAPVFAMEEPALRFSAGNNLLDDSRSENSSSLNFSTDAEDSDYNKLKQSGVLPGHHAPQPVPTNQNQSLDTSNMSQISSPTYYNTDGETTVFPNLQTDDEGTTTERESAAGATSQSDENGTGRQPVAISQKKAMSELDTMAWAHKEKESRIAPASTASNSYSASQQQQNKSYERTSASFQSPALAPSSTASSATPRRNFTSPKKRNTEMVQNDFANFADFGHFEGQAASGSAKSPPRIFIESDRSGSSHRRSSSGQLLVTSGAADTNVVELLERAKSKSSSSRARRAGASSINSAPALSASYLRQHHGLKSRHEARHDRHHSDNRSYQDGTSVTDIIQSLETANRSRHKSGSGSVGGHSRDGASVRSAKERLRRRRERERRSGSPEQQSSESDEDNEENWLMDEVTGALGPRGIAADLESLSGRSNRSRSSGGGRSHKSHRSHRSHKSHGRSSRRKKTSSGESVDSHGSKKSHGSRRSRSSRYSHRSTRSYLSQMSEQSRSVANDLLRLEMQLAMVGGGNDHPEGSQSGHVRSSSNGGAGSAVRSSSSVGGAPSRSSRSGSSRPVSSVSRNVRSSARRNRITVVAPPGKLGIILANKADSKGTVVSGVRTSSVLADRISPGDRIVAIDGEDVSLMTVSEITTIMARKADFERTLSVLTTPKTAPVDPLMVTTSPRGTEYRYRN